MLALITPRAESTGFGLPAASRLPSTACLGPALNSPARKSASSPAPAVKLQRVRFSGCGLRLPHATAGSTTLVTWRHLTAVVWQLPWLCASSCLTAS